LASLSRRNKSRRAGRQGTVETRGLPEITHHRRAADHEIVHAALPMPNRAASESHSREVGPVRPSVAAVQAGPKRGPAFRLPAFERWPIMTRPDPPGRSTPMLSTNISPDVQREMLRQMLTIRRFEERLSAYYLAGKIYGVV